MFRFCLVAVIACWAACAGTLRAADPAPLYTTRVEDITVNIRIPGAVKELRGLVVKPADKGVSTKEGIWETPMTCWGFGEVGMSLDDSNKSGSRETRLARALPKALVDLAEKSGHPELVNLPIVALGMSRGGGWSAAMCRLNADRAIGYVSVCAWMGGDPAKSDASYLKIPGLFIIGSVPDGFKMLPSIDEQYVPAMKQGNVAWTCALSWGAAHDWKFPTSAYCIIYLDQIIKLRLPRDAAPAKGPVTLTDLKWEDGWAGDKSTWDSACPAICALKDFKGDRANLVWQPNRYLAYVWRAYMTQKPEVVFEDLKPAASIESTPAKREYFVAGGSDLPIAVKPVADAKKIRFYDGDILVSEASADKPGFTWKVPVGNHAIIAVAEKADGTMRSSNVLWVVGAPKRP